MKHFDPALVSIYRSIISPIPLEDYPQGSSFLSIDNLRKDQVSGFYILCLTAYLSKDPIQSCLVNLYLADYADLSS